MDSPSNSLSITSSLESLVIESDENVTPCKNRLNKNNSDAATPLSGRRKSLKLNSIQSLPPLRTLVKNIEKHDESPMSKNVKEKPEWDQSFARKSHTPGRLPWSGDLRLRKSSSETASPRTPHPSTINTKRQKQKSQLARDNVNIVSTHTIQSEDFVKPNVLSKSKISTLAEALKQIDILRAELKKEREAKSAVELKYQQELSERVKIEMEYNMLVKKMNKE